MITKDSLFKAKESVNLTLLKIMQSYSSSPSAKIIYFITEGKDDVAFYGSKSTEYIPNGWSLKIIPAGNRDKVVETYRSLDWSTYKKTRILFFVDRDLSDYTGEDTPSDFNVYVTQKYAIENDLCSVDTIINALKFYYDLNNMEEPDEEIINNFYKTWFDSFSQLFKPVMAHILYWKRNNIKSNYSNFKIQNMFEIRNDVLQHSNSIASDEDLIKELFRQSNLNYEVVDVSKYCESLNSIHSFDEYIRGKYLLAFFVKALKYIHKNSHLILPSHITSHATISLGYEDAISKLCGIMRTPESLREFFVLMKENLLKISY